jgi:predicted RNA-binding Zn-ribbon protein involved in translation (DUF1610 family)
MPYHDHPKYISGYEPEETLLVCPDCHGTSISPVKKTENPWINNPNVETERKKMETELYDEEDGDPLKYDWGHYGSAYQSRYAYNAKRRQEHFYCPNCLDQWIENDRDPDCVPIFPFVGLVRKSLKDIQEVKYPKNPYPDLLK